MDALLPPEVQSNLPAARTGSSSGVSWSGYRGRIAEGIVGEVLAHDAADRISNQRKDVTGLREPRFESPRGSDGMQTPINRWFPAA